MQQLGKLRRGYRSKLKAARYLQGMMKEDVLQSAPKIVNRE